LAYLHQITLDAANSAFRKIISLNINYTGHSVTSSLAVKRGAFYKQIKMCHSTMQSKGSEFCLTRSEVMPGKMIFPVGDLQI